MEPSTMSQRAYARHRNVTLRAVQKAIDEGRITPLGNGRIDPVTADREWEENSKAYPSFQIDDDDHGVAVGGQYKTARAVREQYMARLAKLEYEERVGSLVSKDEMKIAAFNETRRFRDHMLNIPDRVAAMVAAETETARCFEIIATEIRKALNEYADQSESDN
jgi:hypothetical protein